MRFLVCIVLVGLSLMAIAQEDTVRLSEVTIYSDPLSLFTVGKALKEIQIGELDQSLTDALSSQGNLYFKSYGNRQLSTVSMRGTSANQTYVLWHGVPVNYPSLGQMDFSQWPAWFLNSVQIQTGNGGALFGSGSLGGTILLDSKVDPGEKKPGIIFRGDLGSYGYSFVGVKGSYRLGKMMGHTKLYRTQIKNDFPYQYNGQKEIQDHAGSHDMGIQQQVVWGTGKHQFQLDGMFTLNDREIQPTKGVEGGDNLETSNARLAATHQFVSYSGSLNTTLAYIRNRTLYNDLDETITDQYSIVTAWSFETDDESAFRVGFNSNIYEAHSENYIDRLNDFRTGLFGSFGKAVLQFWDIALNLRQSFFRDHYPFNPSLNHQLSLFSSPSSRLSLSQSTSTGFRYPTLNDLYWIPGGNPELKPERSLNVDGQLKWESENEFLEWTASVEAFQIWSKDYILWRPGSGGVWSPENFQDVNIKGIELNGSAEIVFGVVSQELAGSYSLTRSLNQSGINSGNQLPYVPIHQASLIAETKWSEWSVNIIGNYTGRRYTTLDNTPVQSVDGFFLVDLGLTRHFKIEKLGLLTSVKVNNVFDQDYENLINRAMPGRNYQLSILLKR